MKKAFPYILLGVLAITALLVKRCRNSAGKKAATETIDRNHVLDRSTNLLEYTEHAKCRMDCIHITSQQVAFVLQNGQVNETRSETGAHPCPVYVLESQLPDKSHLRVVFGQCDAKTKVITCINIDSAFDCHCPGIGIKYER